MSDIDIARIREELGTFDRISAKHAAALLDEIERLRGALAIMTETMHDAVEELGDLNDAVSESLPEVSCDAEGNPGNAIERIQWAGERLAALERVRDLMERAAETHRGCEDGFYACPRSEDYFGDYEAKPMEQRPCECWKESFDAALDAAKEKP